MATIVIGGHSRNIGKTSVVCALISALPQLRWTAIKISQHEHGVCSHTSELCDSLDQGIAIFEERDASAGTDSSRYLAAGAFRSLWVRTGRRQLAEAMPRIRAEIDCSENVILESNSVLRFIKPDIYASVLDPAIVDFKPSALRYLDRADALLMPVHAGSKQGWPDGSLNLIERIPRFNVAPPGYFSPDFARYVAGKLAALQLSDENQFASSDAASI
ncbi:MAG: hypothetical protein M3O31_11520 [Acidobacteriota bacterium]|nr:hypothetical protein [Acidobacteriota bacterium]